MTEHAHTELTLGCTRCELNADEMRGAWDEIQREISSLSFAFEALSERQVELREEAQRLNTVLQAFYKKGWEAADGY